MNLFAKKSEPVLYKDNNTAQLKLEKLKELTKYADSAQLKAIEKDIKITEAGIFGENQILFELKNSHIPMLILHDIYLEHNGLSAQIDFLVITQKITFIIECKNLVGDIEVDNNGNFTRTFTYGGKKHKEGLYSPITQNTRHIELIKQMCLDKQKSFLGRKIVEKNFNAYYCPIVVLANPQTVLYAKYAKKEVKEKIIRADGLIEFIKAKNKASDIPASKDEAMKEFAESVLSHSKDPDTDYTEKYGINANEPAQTAEATAEKTETPIEKAAEETAEKSVESSAEKTAETVLCPKCSAPMIKRVAQKGDNAGKEFYGCSNFPKCRGIVNIK